MRASLAIVGLTLLLGACGGGNDETFTCDIETTEENTCSTYTASSSKIGEVNSTCDASGGTVSTDPCSRPDYLGICAANSDGVSVKSYYYASSSFSTASGAEQACENAGGKWTPAS